MTTATRPEQTALAVRDAAVGNLPTSVQEQLEIRRLSNQVAGELAKLNWGEKLDQPTRRAVADWGRQFSIDVTTEIHVLGGRIYIGSQFYLRKFAEMVAAGLIEYGYADHVEDDKRLKALGPEGEGEYTRRLRERIMHAIPDEARSAVVFRVKVRSMDKEVVGVKWCGTGKKNKYDASKFADPVGEEFPVETSESRAARRAMRLLASHVPTLAEEVEGIEESAKMLSERVVEAKARIADVEARHNQPPKAIAQGDASDPYGVSSRRALGAGQEPIATVDAQPHGERAPAAEPEPETQERDAPVSRTPNRAAAVYPLPFAQGNAKKGTPLAEVTDKDLADALRFATDTPKYSTFVEAATDLLEERRVAAEDSAEAES